MTFLLPSFGLFGSDNQCFPLARERISRKTLTIRLTQFAFVTSTILLILSTAILALNVNTTVVTTHPTQVLAVPVQVGASGREQVYRNMVQIFLRDRTDPPHVPTVLTPPDPIQTASVFRTLLTSSNKLATQLSSLVPMVIISGTLLAIFSDTLDAIRPHLLPIIVIVACAAVRHTSRHGLRMVLVLLPADCADVVRMTLASVWAYIWAVLECPLSLLVYCIETGLAVSHAFLTFCFIH